MGNRSSDEIGARSAASRQASSSHRRLDRARHRAAVPRRHRRGHSLRLDHLRSADPRVHGVGGAQGLRGRAGERRGARDDLVRRHRRRHLAVALRRRRDQDARRVLRHARRHRPEPHLLPGRLPPAAEDDLGRRAGRAAGSREQAGELGAAARGSHRRSDASRASPKASASRSRTSRRRPPTRPSTACRPTASRAGSSPRCTRSIPASRRPTSSRRWSTARSSRSTPPVCRWRTVSACSRSRRSSSARPGSQDDFYKVSRVIQNRLDPSNQQTYGLLQMDSTAQYGYGEMHDGTVSSSQEALDDDNLWNTYVHTGLPDRADRQPGRRRDRRGDASGGRPVALLRDGQPGHRRDRLHRDGAGAREVRRAVAGVVRREPGQVLTAWRGGWRSGATRSTHSRSPQLHARRLPRARARLAYGRRQVVGGASSPTRSHRSTAPGAASRSRCRSRASRSQPPPSRVIDARS